MTASFEYKPLPKGKPADSVDELTRGPSPAPQSQISISNPVAICELVRQVDLGKVLKTE
mgnify:FL=1|jgi:hypothetical protein